MNKKINILYTIIFLLLASCSSQEKIDNLDKYEAVYSETPAVEIDETIKKHQITIPHSETNYQWLNSNLVLSKIPQNLQVTSSLNDYRTYRLFKSKDSQINLLRTPVIYKGTMYVMDYSGSLYAYSLNNMKKAKWVTKIEEDSDGLLGGGISVGENTIVVTSGSNIVTALALDGTEIWKQQLSNISRSTPNIKNNKIFISTIDNRLYCLSLTTGSIMWFYQGANENLHTLQSPSPITHNNLVIHAFSLNEVSAINSDNGQLVWSSDLSNYKISSTNINDVDLTPTISNSSLFLSSFAGDISSINLKNGFVEWTRNKAGSNIAMWNAGNHIYSITKEGYLAATYTLTGSVQWAKKLEDMIPQKERKNISFTGPIMINGLLYAASSNGHLLKISVNHGKLIKTVPITKNSFSFPIVVGQNIYLLSKDGSLTIVH